MKRNHSIDIGLPLRLLAIIVLLPMLTAAGNSALHVATMRGNLERMDKLITDGADVNRPDPAGEYPLHLGIHYRNLEGVRWLLKAGANVDEIDRRSARTALTVAAFRGDVDMARLLLAHGADIEFMGTQTPTALKKGFTALPPGALVHTTSPPLLAAVQAGHDDMVAFLLNEGANPQAVNAEGENGLIVAARFGRTEIADLLLRKGLPVDAVSKQGMTPLNMALIAREPELAQLYLDRGAAPGLTGPDGHAPIHFAAAWGDPEILDRMLGSDVNPDLRTVSGEAPIHYAAGSGSLAAVEMLIASGADLHARTAAGFNGLHYAALGFHADIAATLIALGVEVDQNGDIAGKEDRIARGFARMLQGDSLARHGETESAVAAYVDARALIEASSREYRKEARRNERQVNQAMAAQYRNIMAAVPAPFVDRQFADVVALKRARNYQEYPRYRQAFGDVIQRRADGLGVAALMFPSEDNLEQYARLRDESRHVHDLANAWIREIDRKSRCLQRGGTASDCLS